MIGLTLAYAGIIAVAPGCHSTGSAVVCELDPPAPVRRPSPPAAAKPVMLPPTPRVRITRAQFRAPVLTAAPKTSQPDAAPRPVRTAKMVAAPATPAPPPTGEEVQRRLASLVSIGDCTGARAYARSIGAAKIGDHTFTACVGPQPAPKLSYALDITPRPPVIETQVQGNDAIIDQIPEMP